MTDSQRLPLSKSLIGRLIAACRSLRDSPDVQMDCTDPLTDQAREDASAVLLEIDLLQAAGPADPAPGSLTDLQRLQLIAEVYSHVYEHTETFTERNVGSDLAYLLGALAVHDSCEFDKRSALMRLLNTLPEGTREQLRPFVRILDETSDR